LEKAETCPNNNAILAGEEIYYDVIECLKALLSDRPVPV
jgi:hypothetical protein